MNPNDLVPDSIPIEMRGKIYDFINHLRDTGRTQLISVPGPLIPSSMMVSMEHIRPLLEALRLKDPNPPKEYHHIVPDQENYWEPIK